MKNGINIANIVEKILGFEAQAGGVFSTSELSSIIGGRKNLYNQRMINRLVRVGIVFRIIKGLYVTKKCDLWVLSARIDEKSYVSMDSAFAKYGLTGSVPERSLSVVHCGRKKTVNTPNGDIYFYSIAPEFYFGFSRLATGVGLADREKAFIDLLYFYVKGAHFLIDPLKDVNVSKLDKKKLFTYLKRYKNPKFVKFVTSFQFSRG